MKTFSNERNLVAERHKNAFETSVKAGILKIYTYITYGNENFYLVSMLNTQQFDINIRRHNIAPPDITPQLGFGQSSTAILSDETTTVRPTYGYKSK